MSLPYASVVVPTHDRASTLDLTLESIRHQTVKNIEIIVALDGATDEVKAVAQQAADADKRVIVLDLPKAAGRGSSNRGIAVKSAKSDRIFYSDDDDLWFPDHVEALGAALNECDVVYSPSLSVSLSGIFHIGFVDYRKSDLRNLLRLGSLKILFDTHLAHRRSTYLEVGDPWSVDTDRVVYNLLSALAAPSGVRWTYVERPTALSIHGSTRRRFTALERRDELAKLKSLMILPNRENLISNSRVEWYLGRCFRDLKERNFEDVNRVLSDLGIAASSISHEPNDASFKFNTKQGIIASLVLDLQLGSAAYSDDLLETIPNILDPILGSEPHIQPLLGQMVRSFGLKKAIEITASITPSDPQRLELCINLHACLLYEAGFYQDVYNLLILYINEKMFYPVSMLKIAIKALKKLSNKEESLKLASRAIEFDAFNLKSYSLLIQTAIFFEDVDLAWFALHGARQKGFDSDAIASLEKLLKQQ